MADITQLLVRAREGEPHCLSDVFAALYPELLRMARGRMHGSSATLTPTVLVHEAYLRLTGGNTLSLNDRRHFFACAARAMRSIVVDAARRRNALKRGGPQREITLTERLAPSADADVEVLSLDQALEHMRARRLRQVEIVELHYFAGFGFAEIGELLECSERTAKREWERARAFLHARLSAES
jgi:RNA polymerase sigma factor (TIGR02999 family)